MRPALFLDRDGTIIFDRHYLSDPAGVELIPGVATALSRARDLGYRLFLHTNQSGVGRGLYTLEDVHRCNVRMEELLGLPLPLFDDICIATEGPDDPPVYRKPSPLFLNDMIRRHGLDPKRSWMIGDRESDIETGRNAGIRSAAVCTGKHDAASWRLLVPADVPVFPSLVELVDSLASATSHA